VLHINAYLLPALRAKQVLHLVVSGHVCVCAKTENCSSEIDVTWYEYCLMYGLVIYLTSTFDLKNYCRISLIPNDCSDFDAILLAYVP